MTIKNLSVPGQAAVAALASLLWSSAAWAQTPQFVWPVACEIGRTCVIQQYVDHDPGPGARDYTCGTLVYDGHTGTDIRVPDLAAQRAGVDVLAAADGAVLRTRDGMADVSVATIGEGQRRRPLLRQRHE